MLLAPTPWLFKGNLAQNEQRMVGGKTYPQRGARQGEPGGPPGCRLESCHGLGMRFERYQSNRLLASPSPPRSEGAGLSVRRHPYIMTNLAAAAANSFTH